MDGHLGHGIALAGFGALICFHIGVLLGYVLALWMLMPTGCWIWVHHVANADRRYSMVRQCGNEHALRQVMSECKVCLVEHKAEIHSATLNVRSWLREELRRKLEPPLQAQPQAQPTERRDRVHEVPKSA